MASPSTESAPPPTVVYVAGDGGNETVARTLSESAVDCQVATVPTARACLERLVTGPPVNCVVSEHALPDGDGLSLLRRVRDDDHDHDRDPSVPFVLFADGDEVLASDAIDAGVTAYVPKTADDVLERLAASVQSAVEESDRASADRTAEERSLDDRSLERYRTLVETVGDPMYTLDGEGVVVTANEAMAESLRIERDAVVGTHVSEFMPPADVERGTEVLRSVLADDERTWGRFEMTVLRGDGTAYEAEDNVAPLTDDEGNLVGSVGVVRDITERLDRERRIRRLHEGTRRLMAVAGTESVATVASDVARDALGLEINGVHLYDRAVDGLVPVANSERALALLGEPPTIEAGGGLAWDAYERGESIAHDDVTRQEGIHNPDTEIRSEAYLPLGDHGVLIVGSTAVAAFDEEELTLAKILAANLEAALDRARRESELADRSRELERQNDRLDAFAATVSHDLRNPLTLANGHVESARSMVDDEATVEHLEEASWAHDRMEALIEDVLVLARSGRRLDETREVDLGTVVERAHRAVDPALDVVADSPLPTIEADEQRLRACLENLLRNARQHAGEDVTVTVSATEDGFAVADDGPGIPPADRASVLESGYTTAEEGTGFGLAIVSEVVDAHDWTLSIGESDAGGARFTVSVDEGE